jgi:Fe-S cluster assembly scaffold protein SufB
MAQMNKRPAGVSRRKELEDELVGDIIDKKQEVETGKYENTHTKYSRQATKSNRIFQIRQGRRRRHPDRVLAQFGQIVKETENASSAWEKALMHEQQRVEVPQEYKAKDSGMVANQVGLVTTAMDNYIKSKGKFERVAPVGY